jgi:hypothetical protein
VRSGMTIRTTCRFFFSAVQLLQVPGNIETYGDLWRVNMVGSERWDGIHTSLRWFCVV